MQSSRTGAKKTVQQVGWPALMPAPLSPESRIKVALHEMFEMSCYLRLGALHRRHCTPNERQTRLNFREIPSGGEENEWELRCCYFHYYQDKLPLSWTFFSKRKLLIIRLLLFSREKWERIQQSFLSNVFYQKVIENLENGRIQLHKLN